MKVSFRFEGTLDWLDNIRELMYTLVRDDSTLVYVFIAKDYQPKEFDINKAKLGPDTIAELCSDYIKSDNIKVVYLDDTSIVDIIDRLCISLHFDSNLEVVEEINSLICNIPAVYVGGINQAKATEIYNVK